MLLLITELEEGDPEFQCLTEEETAADVLRLLLWKKDQIMN
jgi:hypothetical protein